MICGFPRFRKEQDPILHQLYNYAPKFGSLLAVDSAGTCKVGDIVYVGQ
jgi:hypothetical protein